MSQGVSLFLVLAPVTQHYICDYSSMLRCVAVVCYVPFLYGIPLYDHSTIYVSWLFPVWG